MIQPSLVVLSALAVLSASTAQSPSEDPVARWRSRATAGPARRIWTPAQQEHQTIWLRHTFDVDMAPAEAEIAISCDNEADIYLNGVYIATATDWQQLLVIDVAGDLVEGENTIALRARNLGSAAVCVGWCVWRAADGRTDCVVTNGDWRVTDALNEAKSPKWMQPGFDDDVWGAPEDHGEVRFFCNASGAPADDVAYRTRSAAVQRLIEQALRDLQEAADDTARLAALDRMEQAVMRARRILWERQRRKPPK